MDRFWEYYGWLRAFREQPSEQRASELRAAFTDLFSTRTGYDQLDKRIAICGDAGATKGMSYI